MSKNGNKWQPRPIPKEITEPLDPLVQKWIDEVCQDLPGITDGLSWEWDNNMLIEGYGTGGTLALPNSIVLAYSLPSGVDEEEMIKRLKGTVFHECYHASQGWSDEDPKIIPKSYLSAGILEGCATVYEMTVVDTNPEWGQFESDEVMVSWLKEVHELGGYNRETYSNYMWGEVSGRKWTLYKLGSWIATKALDKNRNLRVQDLAQMDPDDIFTLSKESQS